MPTSSPVFGWPLPVLADVADGPDAFSDLGLAIEGTLNNKGLLSYTPSWSSTGVSQPANPTARQGLYKVNGPICSFYASISFGSSTNGGRGALRYGLPLPANAALPEQWVFASLYMPASNLRFNGSAVIRSSAPTFVCPGFERLDTAYPSQIAEWMSSQTSVSSGFPDVGVPTVQSGGFCIVQGWYFLA